MVELGDVPPDGEGLDTSQELGSEEEPGADGERRQGGRHDSVGEV
jgi:hypothetical protein